MNWIVGFHDGMLHCKHYTIYRNIRDYAVYRHIPQFDLLGRCESLLEAKLLASVAEQGVKLTSMGEK